MTCLVDRWTLPYLSKDVNKALRNVLYLLENQGMVDIEYRKYDWKLNQSESESETAEPRTATQPQASSSGSVAPGENTS